jgi:dTDP-4-dehydrorhamnose reductase
MKVFVAGSAGQLARALADRAAAPDMEIITTGRPQLDLEHREGADLIAAVAPDAIINAAAYTAVDAAEHESARAFAVNRDGAAWLAGIAAQRKIPFLHVSTDYVFDGAKSGPYTEDDAVNPQNAYGRTKRAGEEAVLTTYPSALVLRTAWVFSPYGQNFVKTMLRLARERDSLRVVSDQVGNPTSAHDIADVLLAITRRAVKDSDHPRGVYHVTAAGTTSWFGFAQEIMRLAAERGHRAVPVVPITTADYPTPAKRPANSQLDCGKLARDFGVRLPCWKDSLAATLQVLLADGVAKVSRMER